MQNKKLEVGQTLWIVRRSAFRGELDEQEEKKVSKVGNKYFELEDDYRGNKYSLETLRQVSDTNYPAQCYFTLQEIKDQQENDKLGEQIRKIFQYGVSSKLTLEQRRKIMEIIGEAK